MIEMPWWAVLYATLFLAGAAWSTAEEVKKGRRRWWVIVDACVSLVWVGFIAAFYNETLSGAIGRGALPLLVGAFLWTAITAHREIAELETDPALSPRVSWAGDMAAIAVGVLFVAPAIGYGMMVAQREW
jgi:hypothetical protein